MTDGLDHFLFFTTRDAKRQQGNAFIYVPYVWTQFKPKTLQTGALQDGRVTFQ